MGFNNFNMGEKPLYEKACAFADRILDMSDFLLTPAQHNQPYLTNGGKLHVKGRSYPKFSVEVCVKQIARSDTSIAANIAEGQGVQSRADLTNKLSVAYKEAHETEYWLQRLKNRKVLTAKQYDSMDDDLQELIKMLVASLNTLKNGRKQSQ